MTRSLPLRKYLTAAAWKGLALVTVIGTMALIIVGQNTAVAQTAAPLTKEVQIFYPAWNFDNDLVNLQFDQISTIVWFAFQFNSDGSLYDPYPYSRSEMVELIATAHAHNVKVVLGFGGSSSAQKAEITNAMLQNAAAREKLAADLLAFVQTYGLDGVDNDLEGFAYANKQNFTLFQQHLYATFKAANPAYRLSIDIGGWYPRTDQEVDLPVVQHSADYIMMMGYPWSGAWLATAEPHAPMQNPDCVYDSGNYCSLRHYATLMDKQKLLFGVPYSGVEFATVSSARQAPLSNTSVRELRYKDFVGADGTSLPAGYTRFFDPVWQTPWYTRLVNGQWFQGHYDDKESLGLKYDLVNSEGLGGIGIWEISMGSTRPELWQLIGEKFGAAQPTVSPTPTATPTATPTPTPTATPTPTPSPTPSPSPSPSPSPTADSIAPQVSITAPANGATIRRGKNTTISAAASDNLRVVRVEFFVNDLRICTDTTTAYTCLWRVPSPANQQYTLTAKAYDAAGNTATSSAVTVRSR